ncbi:autotransporter outer membrane beta-barrel domain-containing protein [Rhizobium sp. ACO-34A]|nr:autotransporter domain-containing protein [Rhizobium sp. ACO-34A]ATN35321.1 autotransporter outer membrane beta-barrel domain-containing protein [Rhizobium sp. ACO-34A]
MRKRRLSAYSRHLGLFTAMVSVSIALPVLAQSVWTGASDNEFSNDANWNPSAPGAGDGATVATGSPQVTTNFVITDLDVSGGNVTVTNTGELTATGGTTLSSGTISINAGGVLNSDVEMNGGGLSIDGDLNGKLTLNSGNVTVNGTLGSAAVGATTALTNNGDVGDVDVSASGTFVNNTGATAGDVTNAGATSNAGTIASLTNTAGTFINNSGGTVTGDTTVTGGTVTNNFVITDADVAAGATLVNNFGATAENVTNAGTLSNSGTIASVENTAGIFTNNSDGTVTDQTTVAGGTVTNDGTLGDVDVATGSTFTNTTGSTAGDVTNAGTSSNAGDIASLTNTGGTFTNNFGGTITGDTTVTGGTVTNNFVISDADVAAGATLVNNTGATAGNVTNAGNTSNAGTIASVVNTGGTFTNNSGGTISGTTTVTGGTVVNNATFANVDIGVNGTFVNNSGAVADAVTNAGTGSNDGTIASLTNTNGLFANTGTISGAADVTGGTLTNDGTVLGAVGVYDGGTLSGSGTTADLTIYSGGTLSPGPGMQTISVDGNLTFATGSTYQVDIDASGNSDSVDVSGAVIISGGTLELIAGTGSYTPGIDYTIITAASGITGSFDNVTSDFAFLTPVLTYGGTGIDLSLDRNDVAFADVASTANGRSTAGAVEALGASNSLYLAVVSLNATTATDAFSQLSGEDHASLKSRTLQDGRIPREAILDRMSSVHASLPGANEGLSVWTTGYGTTSRLEGDGNAAGIDGRTAGLFAGADAALSDEWRVGGMLGYSRTSLDRLADYDTYHLGLYAGGTYGPLGLTAGAIYSVNEVSTARDVSLSNFDDRLTADYRSAMAQAFADISWTTRLDDITLQPFANIAYLNLDTDGFAEDGGAAALSAAGANDDITLSTLGLRLSAELVAGEMPFTISGMLGWRHAFGDLTPSTSFAFAGGSPFLIEGVTIPRNAMVAEAGITVALTKSARLNLTYSGEFGSSSASHAAKANLRVDF